MSRIIKLIIFLALGFFGLAACGGGKNTADPSLAITQIWQTVEVAQTQTGLAVSPTPSLTNTPTITPTLQTTNTPLITNTPLPGTPSATPYSIPTTAGTQPAAVDNAIFIADVTYPDGSEVVAGTPFTKTWQVKNAGPSTWNQDYILIFGWGGDGTDWKGIRPSQFDILVLPGETLKISVSLNAPTDAGNYAASFRLQNDKGYNFGPSLTVVVTVK